MAHKKLPTIFQPNKITYSNQNATALQKNIIYKVFQHLNEYNDMKKGLNKDLFNNLIVSINIKEVTNRTDFTDVYESVKQLMRGQFEYEYNKDSKKHIMAVVPFISANHEYNSETVEIKINVDALPILLHVSKNFTALEAAVALSLRSAYSKKIYELCCSWKDKGGFAISETELKTILGIRNKYKRMYDFKKRVLDTAQRELKASADVWFQYDYKTREKPIIFKIFTEKIILNQENLSGLYAKLYRYLSYAFPHFKNDNAKYICNRLADIGGLESCEKSMRKYINRYKAGKIDIQEIKKLTYSILRNDYGIIQKKGQIKFI